LTRTNLTDVELAASVYQNFGLDDLTLQLLLPIQVPLSPGLEACCLKALFHRDEYVQFADRLQKDRERNVAFVDRELPLYFAAYDAGWGSASDAAHGVAQLAAAKHQPQESVIAHRLQLKVSERLVQPDEYQRSLQFLEGLRQDRLKDHVGYWQLLAAVGRQRDAVQAMNSYATAPGSAEEALLLANAYIDFGQREQAREFFARYAPQFNSAPIWKAYADLLIEERRWNELVELALGMRTDANPLHDLFANFSYYVEGLGEIGRNRAANADGVFQKILTNDLNKSALDTLVAERLARLANNTLAITQQLPASLVRFAKTAPLH
jgi:hypothetical protein